jgi:hypothetical protein
MKNFTKLGALSLLTSALGCAMLAGCAASTDGAVIDDEASVAIDTTSMPLLAGGPSLKFERAPGATDFTVVNPEGWKQVEPGIWEHEEAGVKQQVAVGERGNRSLITSAKKDLEVLYEKRDSGDLTVQAKIAQQEEILGGLHTTSKALAAPPVGSATVSCSFGMYTGPSSAVTSPPLFGAAALGQVVCSGGCGIFTVTTQACCSGVCTPSNAFTSNVCSTVWTAGTVITGSGFGSASANVSPPYITQSNPSFLCN